MTKREQLQENYEDALFALLMDEVATAEGKRLLEENERLKNDPAAAVPEEVTQRCLKLIRGQFTRRNAQVAGRFVRKTFGKVAMLAGVVSLLFSAAFAASPVLRANTLNVVTEVLEDSTNFRFGEGAARIEAMPHIVVNWKPTGFALEEETVDAMGSERRYSKSPEVYFIAQYISKETVVGMDTEDADVQTININGQEATQILKENRVSLIWVAPDNTGFLSIISEGMSLEDVLNIARNLSY